MKDSSKFKNIPVAPVKDLNYITNFEKRVTDLLEKIKNKNAISEETYNKLRPVGSKPGTLYGSAKVHKPLIHGLPPVRHIFSAIETIDICIKKLFKTRDTLVKGISKYDFP